MDIHIIASGKQQAALLPRSRRQQRNSVRFANDRGSRILQRRHIAVDVLCNQQMPPLRMRRPFNPAMRVAQYLFPAQRIQRVLRFLQPILQGKHRFRKLFRTRGQRVRRRPCRIIICAVIPIGAHSAHERKPELSARGRGGYDLYEADLPRGGWMRSAARHHFEIPHRHDTHMRPYCGRFAQRKARKLIRVGKPAAHRMILLNANVHIVLDPPD